MEDGVYQIYACDSYRHHPCGGQDHADTIEYFPEFLFHVLYVITKFLKGGQLKCGVDKGKEPQVPGIIIKIKKSELDPLQ